MKPRNIILKSSLSPGDIVTLTAAVRDLHKAHPGKYRTDVRTPCPDIWEGNPYITPLKESEASVIQMEYPLINRSNQLPVHFISGYLSFLADKLQRDIPLTAFKGDIHISEKERGWISQIEEIEGKPTRFWIIVSGGKFDYTAKWWDPERLQKVVNHFEGAVKFVQVGESGHNHPAISGAIDLRGRTSLRQLIRLVYHSDGIICPVTSLMHLAAAVPWKWGNGLRPCVVIAGGREPAHWEKYPGHTFLDTIGKLDCCATGGCWKARVIPLDDGDKKNNSLCERPVEVRKGFHLPACMNRITADNVIEAVASYLQPLEKVREGVAMPFPLCCGHAPGVPASDPLVWGPRKWKELHNRPNLIVLNQRTEEAWLEIFATSIPCEECRDEFRKLLAHNPPDLSSSSRYFEWTWKIHNLVNKRLGKPQFGLLEAQKAREWHMAFMDRKRICSKGRDGAGPCPHFQKAGEFKGPWCTKGDRSISEFAAHHCPIGHWKNPYEPLHPVGVVIGTYGSVPYIHMHLEARARFNPDAPYLVIDDGSPKAFEISKLCGKYGVEFVKNQKREGHVPGDMLVFVNGHRWAKERDIGLLVKMSRRWVPLEMWHKDLVRIWQQSHATTLNARCVGHGFGFRSECVAMDVKAWSGRDVMRPILDKIAEARDRLTPETPIWAQPHDGLLVEGIIHRAAANASNYGDPFWRKYLEHNPPEKGTGHYAKWPFMGDNRRKRQPNYLWHEWAPIREYKKVLKDWGIDGYCDDDFSALVNPSSNPAVNGYDELDSRMAD